MREDVVHGTATIMKMQLRQRLYEHVLALDSDFLDSMQGLPTLNAVGQSRTHGALLTE